MLPFEPCLRLQVSLNLQHALLWLTEPYSYATLNHHLFTVDSPKKDILDYLLSLRHTRAGQRNANDRPHLIQATIYLLICCFFSLMWLQLALRWKKMAWRTISYEAVGTSSLKVLCSSFSPLPFASELLMLIPHIMEPQVRWFWCRGRFSVTCPESSSTKLNSCFTWWVRRSISLTFIFQQQSRCHYNYKSKWE